jgi:hypothetical protein
MRLDLQRCISLLCVLLIVFTGLVQATHVHPENAKLTGHDCSVCSIAHAGVLNSDIYQPSPHLTRAVLVVPPQIVEKASSFQLCLYIRPPPTA